MAPDRPPLTTADYERALELWPSELLKRVRNVSVVPTWIGNEDRFCVRLEEESGHRFVMIDAVTANRAPAFDHDLVARLLDYPPTCLPIQHLELSGAGRVLDVQTPKGRFRIDLQKAQKTALTTSMRPEIGAANGRAVFIRDYNLWLREPEGAERPLTQDGIAFHAWGSSPDHDLMKVARSRATIPIQPTGCFWAPDSRHLLTQRLDEGALEPYPYLESVPADGSPRPKVHWIRLQLCGEAACRRVEFWIIDVEGGDPIRVQLPPGAEGLEIVAALNGGAYWSADCRTVYLLAASSNSDHVALLATDTASGQSRILHDERVDTFFDFNTFEYNIPNVRLLANRNRMLWYSQRSGHGHLYLIDLQTGGIERALTDGVWCVFDVIHVSDESVFFTAGGREPGRNPYHRHLYSVSLDGDRPNTGLTLLTPEDADHALPGSPTPLIQSLLRLPAGRRPMSPSGRYFVDCYSRIDTPPVTVLRDSTGRLIAEIARADVSALETTGWRPPEAFSAKAADQVTDLYGVLIKPRDFDPQRRYPLIERIYGGPQIIAQPRNFFEALTNNWVYGAYSMAELGFVVAILDGPGTPYRSKAFHDLPWNQADRFGLVHHRAALEDISRTRPWIDLSCVGINGHSYGGYATVMALLLHGDFYKVGVSSAGMYDPMWALQQTPERHLGRACFDDGRHTKSSPAEVAGNYRKFSPTTYADQLIGRLLLAYGDLDENIQPAALLSLINAFTQKGKSYDLVIMPGRGHGFFAEPYFHKRMWDYFIEHIHKREPLRHFKLEVEAGPRAVL